MVRQVHDMIVCGLFVVFPGFLCHFSCSPLSFCSPQMTPALPPLRVFRASLQLFFSLSVVWFGGSFWCWVVLVECYVGGRDVFGVVVILVPYALGCGSFYRVLYLPSVLSFFIRFQLVLDHVCMFEAHMEVCHRPVFGFCSSCGPIGGALALVSPMLVGAWVSSIPAVLAVFRMTYFCQRQQGPTLVGLALAVLALSILNDWAYRAVGGALPSWVGGVCSHSLVTSGRPLHRGIPTSGWDGV